MTGQFPLSTLDQLPVRIDPRAIDDAMAPFLVSESGERRWRKLLNKRKRRTLLRLLTCGQRDRQAIEGEYEHAWSVGYSRYALGRGDLRPAPWQWRGRKLLLDPDGATRIRSVLFAAVLEQLRPRRVVEVGSGNGINLLTLAGAFPDIAFTGVELTQEGVAQARRAQAEEATLDIFEAYSPLEIRDRAAIGRIDFVRGDAGALPFADGSFDLVLTVLAVEQMERIRNRALDEIARVSAGHVLMLEPFRDVNARGLRRLYVRSRDYFRGSIAELRGHGLHPQWATGDFPQEAFLGTALVLCSKS